MLALIGYPFGLEPWIATRMQSYGWSVAYTVFVLLCVACGWYSLRAPAPPPGGSAPEDATTASLAWSEAPPSAGRQVLWCALAATGSFLLLAVSNHICQNIAAIPLLWVAPLAIYLLTFILSSMAAAGIAADCSRRARGSTGVMGWTSPTAISPTNWLQIGVFASGCSSRACSATASSHETLAALPDALLPHAFGRRRDRLGARRIGRTARPSAYFELAFGLVACAALLAFQMRTRIPSSSRLPSARWCSPSAPVWQIGILQQHFARDAQLLWRVAGAGSLVKGATVTFRSSTARSCMVRNTFHPS
jgi:hypothetical protein